VVGVNSGMDALELALRVLRLEPGERGRHGGEYVFATVTSILAAGGRPVLVDPDPTTMNVTLEGVRSACGPKTRAVIPVHLYGRSAPEDIVDWCHARGIALVEDAAQAHGARVAGGRRVGALGGFGCFSFHPSKNLGAFGDGGAIALDDAARGRGVAFTASSRKVGRIRASDTFLETRSSTRFRLRSYR
jgi:dTDP-4-amino-4,6-dideoxygalactose transaminase